MVKALRFKGEKVKKRKRAVADPAGDSAGEEGSSKKVLVETRKLADGEEEEGWVDSEDVGTCSPTPLENQTAEGMMNRGHKRPYHTVLFRLHPNHTRL